MTKEITEDRFERYYALSKKAFEILQKAVHKGRERRAKEILEMVSCYLKDAKYFQSQGDLVNAFAAVNYAHGWIDCACRLGIFKVNNNKLFAVDEKRKAH